MRMKNSFLFNPFKTVLKRKILSGFDQLNRGNYKPLVNLFADNVHYWFGGDHSLGGERYSKHAVELWFERLLRLLPSNFKINSLSIYGPPWRTDVIIEFTDTVSPAYGAFYTNHGIQKIKIVWGKAVDIRTYVDTYKVQTALKILSENGIEEASAPPVHG
jgi:ketosteroid isomerase-like protein